MAILRAFLETSAELHVVTIGVKSFLTLLPNRRMRGDSNLDLFSFCALRARGLVARWNSISVGLWRVSLYLCSTRALAFPPPYSLRHCWYPCLLQCFLNLWDASLTISMF